MVPLQLAQVRLDFGHTIIGVLAGDWRNREIHLIIHQLQKRIYPTLSSSPSTVKPPHFLCFAIVTSHLSGIGSPATSRPIQSGSLTAPMSPGKERSTCEARTGSCSGGGHCQMANRRRAARSLAGAATKEIYYIALDGRMMAVRGIPGPSSGDLPY